MPGDLKTFWDNPGGGADQPDLSGTTVVDRGTDPQVTVDSPNALQPIWDAAPVPSISGQESENSVSGLPSMPNRFEPNATPPPIPTLKDRRPGTIDEQ